MSEKYEGLIFIVSGPSGVGKDTVVKQMRELPGYARLKLSEPKSYTTRRRRKSDPEDTPYVFVSEKRFSELLMEDILEHNENHGHLYGISKSSFEECLCGGNIIKIMDRDGAIAFKEKYPQDAVVIYLKPPSVEELSRRLNGRGSETYAEYNRRMMDNIEELKNISGFDYTVTADDPVCTARIVKEIISARMALRKEQLAAG